MNIYLAHNGVEHSSGTEAAAHGGSQIGIIIFIATLAVVALIIVFARILSRPKTSEVEDKKQKDN